MKVGVKEKCISKKILSWESDNEYQKFYLHLSDNPLHIDVCKKMEIDYLMNRCRLLRIIAGEAEGF